MRFIARLLTVACCVLVVDAAPADARRVALVIGNSAYKAGPLANPVNDAAAVAEALERQLKFDKVLLRRNLDAQGFRAALLELSRETAGAELGLVYFAGHGMEVGGKNYLIPVDATLAKASALALEAIPLDAVLGQLDGVTRLKLVILDACRNNPFLGDKRGSRGLARFEPERNSLIAYAAKEGTAADDGGGRHSPYTAALLKHIATPGLEINLLFRRVRTDVLTATGGAQQPAEYHSLGDKEIFLVPAAVKTAPASTTALPLPGPSPTELAQFCQSVAANPSLAVLEALLAANRGTSMAACIEARIAELRKLALAAPPKSVPEPVVGTFNPKRGAAPLTVAEERALKPKDTFKECTECPEMVAVPAGSFTMGSSPEEIAVLKRNPSDPSVWYDAEGPRRWVAIRRSFAVGKFEVTFAEWDACVAAGGCTHRPDDRGWGRGRHPVINVSWNDITQQYLPWLNRRTGKTYRLLTEAEWEYVARAGTTTPYAFGNVISKSQAQYSEGKWESAGRTVGVGSFHPNAFGLFDINGNAWEWVQDCWHDNYTGAPSDGSAWTAQSCDRRVLRGGSWAHILRLVRSANRYGDGAGARDHFRGFRVGRTFEGTR